MSFSERTDGKYNRKSEYFLVSVKERNMDEFIATLQKDKRRYAEPKADEVLALGPANDTRIKILILENFLFDQLIPNNS